LKLSRGDRNQHSPRKRCKERVGGGVKGRGKKKRLVNIRRLRKNSHKTKSGAGAVVSRQPKWGRGEVKRGRRVNKQRIEFVLSKP